MRQTVNPVHLHLLQNNNRLQKQIVWVPCVGTTVKESLKRTTNSKWATLTKSRIVPCQILWKHNVLHEINQAAYNNFYSYNKIITKYHTKKLFYTKRYQRFFKPPDNTNQICLRWFEKSGFDWISITEFVQFVIINNRWHCICDLLINHRVMFIVSVAHAFIGRFAWFDRSFS